MRTPVQMVTMRWGLILCLVHSGSPAFAQPADGDDPFAGVEEMVVTGATNAAQLLASSGQSVTAFDADTLNTIGATDISDLSDFTPNLEIVTNGSTSPTLFIRGVGLNDFSAAATGAIGVSQDGVQRYSSAIQLGRIFDVESVAVLRGPQGTGPFRNASGGFIQITSRKPSGDFGAEVAVSAGNFDFWDVEATLEAPVVPEILSFRAAFGFSDRAGYVKNRCAGGPSEADKLVNMTGNLLNPAVSHCGEAVFRNTRSLVPAGLPSRLNAQRNWAGRVIAVLTPDLPLDTEWTINVHGGSVDDDTFVGQSIGVNSWRTSDSLQRGLGGFDDFRYQDLDVINRFDALRQAIIDTCRRPACDPATELREARAQISNELVDLDSNPWAGAFNQHGRTDNDTFGALIDGTIQVTESTTLRAIAGYERWDRRLENDFDFSPNRVFENISEDDGFQASLDTRLSGTNTLTVPVEWNLGAVFAYESLSSQFELLIDEATTGLTNTTNRDFSQRTRGGNLYADATVELSESLHFELGARYNVERKSINSTLSTIARVENAQRDEIWDHPTGLFRLHFRPTEDLRFYVGYTHGWKAGTYSATTTFQESREISLVIQADPEQIDSFEAGWSLDLLSDRLSISGAIFYYDYANYQLFTSLNVPDGSPQFVVINASATESYGAELEVVAEPLDGIRLQLNWGWLESQFLDFQQSNLTPISIGGGQTAFVDRALNNTGNRLLNSPQFTASILASVDLLAAADTLFNSALSERLGVLAVGYNGAWSDDVFFDATGGRGIPNPQGEFILPPLTIGQRAYMLHGVTLTWKDPRRLIELSGWVRNMTNEAYKRYAADVNSFRNTTLHFVGEPRTYGITTRLTF